MEVSKPPVTTTEKEKEQDQTKLPSARSEKPAFQTSQPAVALSAKLSLENVIEQVIQHTKAGPSILELKTPEQKKVSYANEYEGIVFVGLGRIKEEALCSGN